MKNREDSFTPDLLLELLDVRVSFSAFHLRFKHQHGTTYVHFHGSVTAEIVYFILHRVLNMLLPEEIQEFSLHCS